MNTSTFIRNDVIISIIDNIRHIAGNNNQFSPFQLDKNDGITYFKLMLTTPISGLRLMMHIIDIHYFIISPDNKVMGVPFDNYKDAVEKIGWYDTHYSEWTDLQNKKGLSKSQFIKDVLEGKLSARKDFTDFKPEICDTEFHPLTKTKGKGSVDIVRNGYNSSIFWINDMPSSQLLYTGTELTLFRRGFRLYNEKENACVRDWEKVRDREAEYVDLISDGSQEYYRKKHFYQERECSHLFGQRYRGLVGDPTVRQSVSLKYSIKKQ